MAGQGFVDPTKIPDPESLFKLEVRLDKSKFEFDSSSMAILPWKILHHECYSRSVRNLITLLLLIEVRLRENLSMWMPKEMWLHLLGFIGSDWVPYQLGFAEIRLYEAIERLNMAKRAFAKETKLNLAFQAFSVISPHLAVRLLTAKQKINQAKRDKANSSRRARRLASRLARREALL
jgi:hypothetical protein